MYFLAYQDLFSCISKEYTWNKHKYHFQIQHTAKKAYPKPAHGPQPKKNLRDLRGTGQLVSFLCCLLQSPSTWLLVGWLEHLSPGPWQQNPLHKHVSGEHRAVNGSYWNLFCFRFLFYTKSLFPPVRSCIDIATLWVQWHGSISNTSSANLSGKSLTACPVILSLHLILRQDTEIFALLQV